MVYEEHYVKAGRSGAEAVGRKVVTAEAQLAEPGWLAARSIVI
jgi:hypothetical protein